MTKDKDEGGGVDQIMLPGLDREPVMKDHPVPRHISSREAGHYYGERRDSIISRMALTDSIKYWNESPDDAGYFEHDTTRRFKYGQLTALLYRALELTEDQEQVASEKRNYRDMVEACVLMCVKQTEFLLSKVIYSAVDSRSMSHPEIRAEYTKHLQIIAPNMIALIAISKGIQK